MSLENAKQNLEEFGKELGLEGLKFDENNTCILGIDDKYSLHITYEPNSKRLYLYSPLLDGLPKDEKLRLKLYEQLLQGSLLGGQMAGGGVGVAVNEELVLVHSTLDIEHAQTSALRNYAPIFVEMVERWRKTCEDICEGREVVASPMPQAAGLPQATPQGIPGPAKGPTSSQQNFIKI